MSDAAVRERRSCPNCTHGPHEGSCGVLSVDLVSGAPYRCRCVVPVLPGLEPAERRYGR